MLDLASKRRVIQENAARCVALEANNRACRLVMLDRGHPDINWLFHESFFVRLNAACIDLDPDDLREAIIARFRDGLRFEHVAHAVFADTRFELMNVRMFIVNPQPPFALEIVWYM